MTNMSVRGRTGGAAGVVALVVAGLSVPVGAADAAVPSPGAAGIGDSVHPGLGNGGYDVVRYGADIAFNDALSRQQNTSTITARATQDLSRFNLDLAGPKVRSVTVDGRVARWVQVGEELQITPARPVRKGAVFTVRTSVAASIPVGIKQIEPVAKQGKVGLLNFGNTVQTLSQPSGAHRFVALADHPAQKAPATIRITAPSRFNSIANGQWLGTTRRGGMTTRTFVSRERLAPELMQIGVGKFTVTAAKGPGGVTFRNIVPSDKVNKILPQLKRFQSQQYTWLTQRLGPFPLKTYGVYATPVGGELETQGLALMAVDELAQNGVDAIMLHEMSHEYFGNSVSPRRWSDLWLNEGQAKFYEALWSTRRDEAKMLERLKREYAVAQKLMRQYGPIAAPRRSSFSPASKAPYSSLVYAGGAVTLYALRQEVGQETFDRIQRTWVQTYRDRAAGTAEYIAVASRVAGRDLGPFLRSWLYSSTLPKMPGHPDW